MPLTATSPQPAAWWTRQRGLSTAAAVAVQALWDDRVDPDAVLDSWAQALPASVRILTAAGTAAAAGAGGYVGSLVTAAGLAPASAETLVPSAFTDPESIARALHVPGIRVLRRIGEGQPPGDAMAAGRRLAGTIAAQRTADAGRDAVSAAIVAEPRVTGWIRVLRTPSCGRCAILAGRVYAWSDGFARHPQCFPAGTVVSGPAARAATRRWYEGELVVIATAGGKEVAATANHPVLTDRGWVPANLVQPGHHVVSSALAEGAVPLVVPHEQQMPARIEDLWCPGGVVPLLQVPTTAEDFHGDGGHGDVHVVLPDRLLRGRFQPTLDQPVDEVALALALVRHKAFAGDRQALQFLQRSLASAGRSVRSVRLAGALAGCHLAGAYESSLGHVPGLDAVLLQSAADHVAADPVAQAQAVLALALKVGADDVLDGHRDVAPRWDAPAGPLTVQSRLGYAGRGQDLRHRLAGQVALDRVVEVRRVRFAGHVYNLTSSEGWYSANGVIVSNCDCVHEPLVEGQPIPRVLSPGAYFESLTTEEQDRLFGKDTAAAIRDGTPMNKAVNADRGMWRSSAPSSRNIYEPRRPAVAMALASSGGDRAKAAGLLREWGYFAEHPNRGGAAASGRGGQPGGPPRVPGERTVAGSGGRGAGGRRTTSGGYPMDDDERRMLARLQAHAERVQLAPDERTVRAVADYQSGGHRLLGRVLWEAPESYARLSGPEMGRVRAMIRAGDLLTRAVRSPGVVVWRATVLSDRLMPQYVFSSPAFMSASVARSVAETFLGRSGMLLRLHVPAGSLGAWIEPYGSQEWAWQHEFLIARDARIVVRERRRESGVTVVYGEVTAP